MPLDIAAVQQLYGVSTSSALSGGQTFGFNCNIADASRELFDFTHNTTPIVTLWDSGGYNTLDLSGYSSASTINLNPGGFSSCDGLVNNIGIAYGSKIDNAVGGAGNDTFVLNTYGDSVNGGGGANTVILEGTQAQYTYSQSGSTLTVVPSSSTLGGTDQLTNIQDITFAGSGTTVATISLAFAFTDTPGNQLYIGNGGHDTLAINESRRGDTVSVLANGDQAVTHGGQVDTLRGIADVQYFDGREVFDPNDPAAQVLRLYQAAFGRAPDQAGLHGWVGALQQGTPLSAVAGAFLGTPEFAARYGAGLSTTGFVTALYQNALGRAPDAAGLAGWVGQISSVQVSSGQVSSGQVSQAQVLTDFSESAENRADTAGLVAAGIWDVSGAGSEVAHLYDTAFGRLPDVGGFTSWVAALNSGASLQALAGAFVTSAEFTNTYGALDNAGFVQALYGNTLHRAGDAAGVAGWTGALAQGATRAQVVVGFSESAEHKASTAPNIMSNDPSQYGIRMTWGAPLDLGKGRSTRSASAEAARVLPASNTSRPGSNSSRTAARRLLKHRAPRRLPCLTPPRQGAPSRCRFRSSDGGASPMNPPSRRSARSGLVNSPTCRLLNSARTPLGDST